MRSATQCLCLRAITYDVCYQKPMVPAITKPASQQQQHRGVWASKCWTPDKSTCFQGVPCSVSLNTVKDRARNRAIGVTWSQWDFSPCSFSRGLISGWISANAPIRLRIDRGYHSYTNWRVTSVFMHPLGTWQTFAWSMPCPPPTKQICRAHNAVFLLVFYYLRGISCFVFVCLLFYNHTEVMTAVYR